LDVTFLVAADTHFGSQGLVPRDDGSGRADWRPIGPLLEQQFAELERTAGRQWPASLGGRVSAPRGILVAGDLTESGRPSEFAEFVQVFGGAGGGGRLPFPAFIGPGNHDLFGGTYVVERIRERHGAVAYSFDWDDLHVVSLGEAPDYRTLGWLMEDLARIGRERPVVLFQHYPLAGRMADGNWFGRGDYREHLSRILDGFNVVAVFHGHYHASAWYRWNGIDVFNVGSPKHGHNDFFVVRITDERLTVASRWWKDEPRWWWWWSRPINGAEGTVVMEADVRPGDWRRPLVPMAR
jgi:3',5'-cyclic AMP phosphodiesterase CpdA